MGIRIRPIFAVLAVLAAMPASADALSRASNAPPSLSIDEDPSAPDAANRIDVAFTGDAYVISDAAGVTTVPGPDNTCAQASPTVVSCPATGIASVSARLGGGDDSLTLPASSGLRSAALDLGFGNDRLAAGAEEDTVSDPAGDDDLRLGAGFDSVHLTLGRDVVHLGPGPDLALVQGSDATVDGGSGKDFIAVRNAFDVPTSAKLYGGADADILAGNNNSLSDRLECGAGSSDLFIAGAGDVATTDCELAGRQFGCVRRTCRTEIEVSARAPRSSKAEATGRRVREHRVILAHRRFTLHRAPPTPVGALLRERPVRRLFRRRGQADVTASYNFTGADGKRRNIKVPYVLATP